MKVVDGFNILTVVIMKISVFWEQIFQSNILRHARKDHDTDDKYSHVSHWFLGLLLNPENRGGKFLQNV
jgi:hypothetical protein